jgi:hypothetical protein
MEKRLHAKDSAKAAKKASAGSKAMDPKHA